MNSQEQANHALRIWQSLRHLEPSERLDVLMRDYFAPPILTDLEYQIMLNRVSEEMEHV